MVELLAADITDAVGWADAVRAAGLIVALVGGLTALGAALSKRIRREAERATAAADAARVQLATSNGNTAGQLIDQVAADSRWLRSQAEHNRETAMTALSLSREAVALGRSTAERLGEHERTGHGGQ